MALRFGDGSTGAPTGHPLPPRGDYNHQPVVGPYRVELTDALRQRTYFGLSHKATLCYGTFRDGNGVAFTALRKVGWESASPLTLQTTLDGGAFRVHEPTARAFKGWGVRETLRAGLHTYASEPGPEGAFRIEHGTDRLTWTEGALIDLEGRLAGGCGIQWYDPSPPGGFYVAEQYRVTGTVLGSAVEGFVALDQLFLPAGMTWAESPFFSSAPYLEIAWNTFGTEFDDGTVEVGQVFFGAQRMSFAGILDQDGPAVFSRDVSAEITSTATGYPAAITYRIDGEPWQWTAEEQWQMPDFARGYPDDTYRPSEGLFVRADEHRRPRVWWSFIDSWTTRRDPW
jgi:hypothetical protein